MAQLQTFTTNRFTKMLYLQYHRAKRLQYPNPKAIAYAEALKYAIFKRRHSTTATTTAKRYHRKHRQTTTTTPTTTTYNKTFQLHFTEDNYPIFANKKITDKDFTDYISKLTKEQQLSLSKWAHSIISTAPTDYLLSEQKFFNKVYKPHRDDEIPYATTATDKQTFTTVDNEYLPPKPAFTQPYCSAVQQL